jgi:hypothetical protein
VPLTVARTSNNFLGSLGAPERNSPYASFSRLALRLPLRGCRNSPFLHCIFLVRAYAALALRYGILLNRRCPECGLPPHGPGRIVTVEGDPDHDPQERCSECGRFLWTTILIVYEDSEGSDAASTAEGGGVIAGA